MKPAERNYPVHDKELLAMRYALIKFRVRPDYDPRRLTRYQGVHDNEDDDEDCAVCVELGINATVSSPILPLRQQIADAYDDDAFYAGIIRYPSNPTADALAKLTRPTRDTITRYDLDGDLLTYAIDTFDTPRVVIPADDDLRARLVHEYHDAPVGGHLGREKTFAAISRDFFWPRIMDFIFGLPRDAQGRTGILVFVDCFSNIVHLAPVTAEVTADESAELFLDLVFRHHGLPESIMSDRKPRFTSAFWTRLFALLGTRLLMSTVAHPETDGQTERVNRTGLTPFFVNNARHPRVPPLLAVRISNPPAVSTLDGGGRAPTSQSVQSSSDPPQSDEPHHETAAEVHLVEGHAHHGVAYERLAAVDAAMPAASTVANFAPKPTPAPIDSATVSELLLHRQAVTRFVRDALQATADQQKANEDRRGRKNTLSFRRGDMVLLSTDGIQCSAVTNLGANKLAPRFIGSFKILKVIGDSYTLEIPTSMRLHPTFYVGCLKPLVPATIPALAADRLQLARPQSTRPQSPHPPPARSLSAPADDADAAGNVPSNACNRNILSGRWLELPPAEDTWEPRERLMEDIPDVVKDYEATSALVFDDGSLEPNHDLLSIIAQEYPQHESMGNDAAVVTDISDNVRAKSRGARRRDENDDDHTRGIDMDVSAATLTATRVAGRSTMFPSGCTCLWRA
ncbi:unnamed protein product [Phytophthora fragariaefolia]|uniref:Unnamed protein product n=1 Tax=Phytophthora fragariaefolia TaxID=1490495 RepID=A0A9W6Y5V2_9STRA|nr:unnamed protein product [Phytophthora fragariaefolia]